MRSSGHWMLDVEDSILATSNSPFARGSSLTPPEFGPTRSMKDSRIETPYKHVLSKGVFIGLRRDPSHDDTAHSSKRTIRIATP